MFTAGGDRNTIHRAPHVARKLGKNQWEAPRFLSNAHPATLHGPVTAKQINARTGSLTIPHQLYRPCLKRRDHSTKVPASGCLTLRDAVPNAFGSHLGGTHEQQTPPPSVPPGWGRSMPAFGSGKSIGFSQENGQSDGLLQATAHCRMIWLESEKGDTP